MVNFQNIYLFDFGILERDTEYGIFRFFYSKDVLLTSDILNSIFFECNSSVLENKKYKIMHVMTTKISPTKEAYDFFSSQERVSYIEKEAFVLNSPALKIAANFYLKVKKPLIPTKIFDDESQAIDYLIDRV